MVITVGRGVGAAMDSIVTTATVGQQVVHSQNSSQCRVNSQSMNISDNYSQSQCKTFIEVGQSQTVGCVGRRGMCGGRRDGRLKGGCSQNFDQLS